jgi:cytochrome c553
MHHAIEEGLHTPAPSHPNFLRDMAMTMSVMDLDVVHVDAATFAKKRKRTPAACVRCHERKVKCDASMYKYALGGCCIYTAGCALF